MYLTSCKYQGQGSNVHPRFCGAVYTCSWLWFITERSLALFCFRTTYVLADVMDDQLKSMWFSPFQAEEIDTDLDMVKGFINVKWIQS